MPSSVPWGLHSKTCSFQSTNFSNCSLKASRFSSTVLSSTTQKGTERGVTFQENLLSVTENTAWPSAGGWYADIAVRLIAMEPTQSSNCFRAHKQALHSWCWNAADGSGKSSRWNAQQKTRAAYKATSLKLPCFSAGCQTSLFSTLISQLSSKALGQRSLFFFPPPLFFFFLNGRDTVSLSWCLSPCYDFCLRCVGHWSFLPRSVVLYKQTILCPRSK